MKNSGIGRYLSNLRLIFFEYLIIICLGVYAWLTLPRELMPSVDLPVAVVSVVLPGASPQDIEDLVVVPIEDKIRSVNGLDTLRSTSMENAGILVAQFEDGYEIDDLIQKIREQVDSVSLPDDAQDPTIMKIDFDDSPVWTFALTGDDKVGLNRVAEKLQDELERQSIIDRVEISGLQEREIVVHMDQSDINKFGVHPAVLAQAVAAATSNIPAGSVNLGDFSYSVSLDKEVSDIDSLRQMAILLGGVEYQLGEVAEIYEQEKPGGTNAYQLDSAGNISQVVTLNVYKTAGAAIDAAGQQARTTAQEFLADYPQYELKNITDTSQEIADTFDDLFENIYETIALVFIIMFVFLGIREATVSAVSIPVVMLVSFAGMMAFGLSLNFISMFALLLSLGMLVDNAIVVVTALSRAYFDHRDQKVTALQAGVAVWEEFFTALMSTNLTTIWAFLPLLLVGGIMGKFIQPMGIIVTVAMVASALVAMLLTLPLGIYILEPRVPTRVQKALLVLGALGVTGGLVYVLPKNWLAIPIIIVVWLLILLVARWGARRATQRRATSSARRGKIMTIIQDGFISTQWLENLYQTAIDKILSSSASIKMLLIAIVILTVASFALPIAGYVHTEFFPKEEADSFSMVLTLPVGTNTDETTRVTLEFLPQLSEGVPELDYITAQIGSGGSSSLISGGSSSNQVLFTFNLLPEKQRTNSSTDIAASVRERWKNNPYGTIEVSENSTVSAGGSDIQMYVLGDDLDVLAAKAEEMVAWLSKQPGAVDVSSDLDDTSKRLVFKPNSQVAKSYGLTNSDFAVWLRSTLSGWSLGSIRQDDDDVDITLRQQTGLPSIEELNKIQIPISGVGYIPVTSLGEFRVEPNLAQITRKDFRHAVTITASVESGYSSTELNRRFEQFIDNELDLPAGYGRDVGGVQQMNNDALSGLALAMGVAFFLILLTLVIQLRSFRKAFIVMSAIPVAISGVFISFALIGWSLSLPAIVGVLALFGIVVNNSILIVERINQNLDAGLSFHRSVIDGCTSRLQPILLTSLTTIFGLVPITLSDPLWQGLGGSIICGLTFSGVLILFYIPALYALIFEPSRQQASERRWQKTRQRWQQ